MPGLFHLGWALLLVLVALGLLSRKRVAGGWLSTVWQVALAGAVVGWGGWLLGTIARDHGPGLELESLRLAPNSAGAVVLGSDEEHEAPDVTFTSSAFAVANVVEKASRESATYPSARIIASL